MFAIALLFAISADTVLYQAGGHLYSLAKTDGNAMLLLDYESGRLWRLRPGGDGYIGGPSIGIDAPIAIKVLADDRSITIERGGTTVTASRANAFTNEDFEGGTLYVPKGAGRHPAIIAISGTGTRRSMALPSPYFARRGIAVLALDARNGTFAELAGDAVVAANALRRRSDIGPIGVYGSSQGGWIAPIAAAKSDAIAFIVCAACPGTPMPQQELIRTASELEADGFAADEIARAVAYRRQLFAYLHDGSGLAKLEQLDADSKGARWYSRFGGVPSREAAVAQWWRLNDSYDPVESWRRIRVPALLLFGEHDTRVPPGTHARLISGADPKATIVIVRRIDHEGFVAVTGGRDEVPNLDRLPPRAMESTIDWIQRTFPHL